MVATHHVTFCVNSLAHYLGETAYEDEQTPRDHFITALITFGEGYHNFHHTFPRDYRNAVRWWQYDPTKWLIWSCSKIGLAHGLRRFPENEVSKARVIMTAKRLELEKRQVNWGMQKSELPKFTWDECKCISCLVIIYIYYLLTYYNIHSHSCM
jgi:stearoyl-CoA desaturase (delta-9 desaturase)